MELNCRALSWLKEFQHWHGKNEKCNCKGDYVAAMAARHVTISSPHLAETMAIRDATLLVKEKQLQAAVFEGDALFVMAALQHKG
ncbi:hypothetical protein D8674_038658 [Pyrus ussuriensis x Pyrus communis]|uniref:Uncharacterized protein n=1 Tax=Pyrus ussuriensis x Pyrus communis TaxID=2448454 RepID=A0A5N5HW72_9ROSA|nr:hypothetical protein D8674_038658 [Pyrus ussuriensis x Pyrus communis]